jgi:hypothetical protein
MGDENLELVKAGIDALSVLTLMGWLVGALPAIATLLTIIWTGLRIWETETVQRVFGRKKD